MTRVSLFNLVEPVVPLFRGLATFLGDQGHDVDVVISRLEYRRGRGDLRARLDSDSCSVNHVGGRLRGPRSVRRMEATVRYLLGAAKRVAFGPKTDVNIVLSQPPGLQTLIIALAMLRGQRCVAHIMDIYPDAVIAAGNANPRNPFIKLWDSLNRWGLQRADAVVVIGDCMALKVAEKGVPPRRIHTIRNWSHDLPQVTERAVSVERRRITGHPSPYVVGYSGNVGVAHDLTPLLDAARMLRHTNPDIFVLIRTKEEVVERLIDQFNTRQLSNVLVMGLVDEEELALSLRLPHIHVVSLRPEFTGLVVPSKAYGALQAARPIIYLGSPRSEIGRDLQDHAAGRVAQTGAEVAQAILDLQGPSWEQYSKNAAALAKRRSADAALQEYHQVIAQLT